MKYRRASVCGWTTLFFACICLLYSMSVFAQEAKTASLWEVVKKRAEESGEKKAIWKELKKLSAEELLTVGEQYCQEVERAQEDKTGWSVIITVNAILSYHKDKTSYDETARAVGDIISTSPTRLWIYGAMEWIENNDHYKHISDEGMIGIATGILECLQNGKRPAIIRELVLKKTASWDIFGPIPAEYRRRIALACQQIADRKTEDAVVRQAQKTVEKIEKISQALRK